MESQNEEAVRHAYTNGSDNELDTSSQRQVSLCNKRRDIRNSSFVVFNHSFTDSPRSGSISVERQSHPSMAKSKESKANTMQ